MNAQASVLGMSPISAAVPRLNMNGLSSRARPPSGWTCQPQSEKHQKKGAHATTLWRRIGGWSARERVRAGGGDQALRHPVVDVAEAVEARFFEDDAVVQRWCSSLLGCRCEHATFTRRRSS